MFKLMDKKKLQFYTNYVCLTGPLVFDKENYGIYVINTPLLYELAFIATQVPISCLAIL